MVSLKTRQFKSNMMVNTLDTISFTKGISDTTNEMLTKNLIDKEVPTV